MYDELKQNGKVVQEAEGIRSVQEETREHLIWQYENKQKQIGELEEKKKEQEKYKKKFIRDECERLGHVYAKQNEEAIGNAIASSFMGSVYRVKVTEVCAVCGAIRTYQVKKTLDFNLLLNHAPLVNIPKAHQEMLAQADTKYTEEIETKIKQAQEELEKIKKSCSEFCEMSGHHYTAVRGESICKCCGKKDSSRITLIRSHGSIFW